MSKNILNSLSLIWLSENESQVYLSLYKIWNTIAWNIVKDVWIPRSTVYQVLDSLIKKQLVLKIDKWNIFHYIAEEPEKIFQNILEEEKQILRKKKIFDYILPELIKVKNPNSYKSKVIYFEWIENYISLLDDVLNSKEKEIFMITNSEITSKHIWDEIKHKAIFDYEEWDFLKERIKRKIKLHLITSKNDIWNDLILKDKLELRETKILPTDFWDVESLVIYWDKILLLTDNSPVIWIYIEDLQLKNMFKSIFDFIWKRI